MTEETRPGFLANYKIVRPGPARLGPARIGPARLTPLLSSSRPRTYYFYGPISSQLLPILNV